MSGSTRRGLLGGAAVLAVAPVAPAVSAHPHPDHELIGVCAEFDAIERHINSHYAGGSRKIAAFRSSGATPRIVQGLMLSDISAAMSDSIVVLSDKDFHVGRSRVNVGLAGLFVGQVGFVG